MKKVVRLLVVVVLGGGGGALFQESIIRLDSQGKSGIELEEGIYAGVFASVGALCALGINHFLRRRWA